jgi:hypothetical protein
MQRERGQARIEHDVVLEIEDALDVLERHVEQERNAGRQRLQEPDVRNRRGELNVAHALAPDAAQGDLDAALLADDALELHALVLAAKALVVLHGAEDARAEQAVTLGLERTVVDGLGLFDLAIGPAQDLFRARDRDLHLIEHLRRHLRIERVHYVVMSIHLLVSSYRAVRAGRNPHTPRRNGSGRRQRYSAACGGASSPSMAGGRTSVPSDMSSSTLRPRERISLTRTLKLSGMPASKVSSPRTMAS